MNKVLIAMLFWIACGNFAAWAAEGIETVPSNHSFKETVERVEKLIAAKGATMFAKIDHAAEAQKVGLTLGPTVLFVFGNPKAGTVIMAHAQLSAIDLPLKLLVSEDSNGKTWVSVNSAAYLSQRHKIPTDLAKPLGAAAAIANEAAGTGQTPVAR